MAGHAMATTLKNKRRPWRAYLQPAISYILLCLGVVIVIVPLAGGGGIFHAQSQGLRIRIPFQLAGAFPRRFHAGRL